MIEKIIYNEILLAIIIHSSFQKDGIEFFTPGDFSQQLGYMNRPEGYIIPPHWHNIAERKVTLTQEVLYVKSGRVRIDFYTSDEEYIKSVILKQGDVILLASGGHGFEMLEQTEMIEIKQGPYLEKDDKKRFDPISKEKLIF
jgi:hypothetical protein